MRRLARRKRRRPRARARSRRAGRRPAARPTRRRRRTGSPPRRPRSARRSPSRRSPCRGRAPRARPRRARPAAAADRERPRARPGLVRNGRATQRPLPGPPTCESASTASTCRPRDFSPPRKSPTPHDDARAERQRRSPASAGVSRRRAAWRRRRRAGSRGRGRPPRPSARRCGRGATATACRSSARASGSRPALRSSISRRPRCTWPSSRPSSVGRNDGPRRSSRTRPTSCSSAAREQQVGAQPRVELRGLARERRHADRVLEQAARVGVVRVRGRERAQRRAELRVAEHAARRPRASPACEISPARNSRNPSSSSASRRICGASRPGSASGGLERAQLELEPVAEARDAAEDAHRVAFREARVEELDVVPDPRLDPPGRIDELEREIRRALLRPQPLLARDRVHAFDRAVLRQLGDRAHADGL